MAETAATSKPSKMEKYQYVMSQSEGHIIPTCFLLENQSTVKMFSNRRLLKNISKTDRDLAVLSTRGKITTNVKKNIPGYGTVWFSPGGIKNILYLSKVTEKYCVSYERTGANTFLVYLSRGEVILF